MFEIKNICMDYRQGKDNVSILKNINFQLKKGECLSVVGESGCGKTTLLNVIAGILQPTEGTVTYDGKPPSQYKYDIAVVSQDYGLFPWKTVKKNIGLPLQLKKNPEKVERTKEMMKRMGLEHVKNSYPSQLSGGQKQRVAIARGLLSDPKIILLDEPFSALDPMMRDKLSFELRSYFKEKQIIAIIVTHSIREAVYFGDQVLVLPSDNRQPPKLILNPTAGSVGTKEVKIVQKNVQKAMVGEF